MTRFISDPKATETCRSAIAGALAKADANSKKSLLRPLAAMGDEGALKLARPLLTDGEANVRDAAVRALCDWRTAAATDELLTVAQKCDSETHRGLALRAYLRLMADSGRPADQLVAGYAKAMKGAASSDDRRAIMAELAKVAHPDVQAQLEPWLTDKDVRDDAAVALLRVARQLAKTDKAAAKTLLEKIIAQPVRDQIKTDAKAGLDQIK